MLHSKVLNCFELFLIHLRNIGVDSFLKELLAYFSLITTYIERFYCKYVLRIFNQIRSE